MEAIKTIGLTKTYGDVQAVADLNLTVSQGELFALLGVNGAGKTTTIKMLCGLTAPTAGDALLGGYSVTEDPSAVRSIIALSPQETAVAPNLTVEENLSLMAAIHGFRKGTRKEKRDQIIEKLGLEEVRKRKAGKLSGGWQRRLSLAMALICEPMILFLDEPTLGLDVLARSELWDLLRSLKGSVTMILTTHYMEEAQALSDRIAVMAKGRLLRVGTSSELIAATGTEKLEEAFVALVKGVSR